MLSWKTPLKIRAEESSTCSEHGSTPSLSTWRVAWWIPTIGSAVACGCKGAFGVLIRRTIDERQENVHCAFYASCKSGRSPKRIVKVHSWRRCQLSNGEMLFARRNDDIEVSQGSFGKKEQRQSRARTICIFIVAQMTISTLNR